LKLPIFKLANLRLGCVRGISRRDSTLLKEEQGRYHESATNPDAVGTEAR
jgi:hypothetical protein